MASILLPGSFFLRQGFDELLELAEKGDHRKVDMLVFNELKC